MGAVVAIVGEGLLADFVCEALSGPHQVFRQTDFKAIVPEAAELVLVLQDDWNASVNQEAEAALQPSGKIWLSGFASSDEGVVGPLVRPGTPGCSQCADMRRQMAGRGQEMSELQMMLLVNGGMPRQRRASRTALWQLSRLLAAEARRVLQGGRARSEGRVYLMNMNTLESSLHFFLPDPLCPVCGRIPDDTPAASRISLQPNPKISASSYRCRPLDDLKKVLVKDYLDDRTGLLKGKMIDLVSPFADVCVSLPLFAQDEITAGRTHSYVESELTAILEGLERNCGMAPRGKRTVMNDSYRHVAEQALNPVTVGVYTKEQYAQPDFPFQPFDPDRPIDWVWGYSFLRERPILVPELLAYYSVGFGEGFVNEASSGCALGGSLEEAVLYGILEVVERDSFLMTWYAQLPVPRLDPYSAGDRQLRLMVDRLQAVTGYKLHLFNTTMENGIPSVVAIAKNSKPAGVNLICAAGAHLDPVRAAKSAIHELAGILPMLGEKLETNREDYVPMLHDASLVRQMEDHSMLYSLPEAEERLHFLLDGSRPLRTFDEEFKLKDRRADLTDDLKDVIQTFGRLNLEVIVIDQSTPETLRNGLYCVKVLIPGMLPMTFGHHLTRLAGLERVLTVPAELGFRKQRLAIDQLNPHPHPFP
ncbi:TOMM precursor leader peptide-binding protein [Paenibacillus validus]|uniref:TOMM precursor leader peptide-binding protein n=1 Tax=Paenibacillus validus TaxID=44253 RepID=UPI000FD9D68A|nr:TOMM precursor leader peptide-binding protein [Paenibacillus validus]MED4599380.1 TOMM precursor leader peptide-binding protein [Paenibacillus validus]MED4606308.1 TOMM precursor leader peptide-binding protein [Paenibacillus validus]